MFKTLTLRQSGPAQAAAYGSLTTGGRTAGNTETRVAPAFKRPARKFGELRPEIWRNEIDG